MYVHYIMMILWGWTASKVVPFHSTLIYSYFSMEWMTISKYVDNTCSLLRGQTTVLKCWCITHNTNNITMEWECIKLVTTITMSIWLYIVALHIFILFIIMDVDVVSPLQLIMLIMKLLWNYCHLYLTWKLVDYSTRLVCNCYNLLLNQMRV